MAQAWSPELGAQALVLSTLSAHLQALHQAHGDVVVYGWNARDEEPGILTRKDMVYEAQRDGVQID